MSGVEDLVEKKFNELLQKEFADTHDEFASIKSKLALEDIQRGYECLLENELRNAIEAGRALNLKYSYNEMDWAGVAFRLFELSEVSPIIPEEVLKKTYANLTDRIIGGCWQLVYDFDKLVNMTGIKPLIPEDVVVTNYIDIFTSCHDADYRKTQVEDLAQRWMNVTGVPVNDELAQKLYLAMFPNDESTVELYSHIPLRHVSVSILKSVSDFSGFKPNVNTMMKIYATLEKKLSKQSELVEELKRLDDDKRYRGYLMHEAKILKITCALKLDDPHRTANLIRRLHDFSGIAPPPMRYFGETYLF